ncbi:MAG: translin-associated factor [Lasallia pustulata]|uniref:Translin-associated factor n=1 Tax=Lasallia pustulata TaxID=136370 RepID=A0A5M8PMX4_9LECA|nr:MAG: translin-associated factor [Lasallia pustulata]
MDTSSTTTTTSSPFMPIFETFRDELDRHHDRRERIIKASRDITALSKKMIFSLQRVRQLNLPLPADLGKEMATRQAAIDGLFTAVSPDLEGVNAWRYQKQVAGGVQEYVEGVSFRHYLETQRLVTYAEAQSKIPGGVALAEDDYLLGLFDLVGELMRFAITSMATNGELPGGSSSGSSSQDPERGRRDILADLRSLRTHFEALNTTSSTVVGSGAALGREVEKKMEVMKTCVEKVENAVYGMIVRGRERPKGWVPDLREDRAGEPVESY